MQTGVRFLVEVRVGERWRTAFGGPVSSCLVQMPASANSTRCTKHESSIFPLINGPTHWCRRPLFKGGGRKAHMAKTFQCFESISKMCSLLGSAGLPVHSCPSRTLAACGPTSYGSNTTNPIWSPPNGGKRQAATL